MSIEDRLREHLAQAGEVLPEPPDRFTEVVRRGRRRTWTQRSAVAVAAAALLLTAPFVVRGLDDTTVDLAPADPPPAPPVTDTDEGDHEAPLRLADLGAPVLAWGPYEHDRLVRVDGDREEVVVSHPVDAAYPDGIGGVVYQPASQSQVQWSEAGQPLVEAEGELTLRGMLPGGRVLYSVRHGSGETETEDFFTVPLAADAEPDHLVSTPAYESSIVGPAVAADRRLVHASCHIRCSLWVGLADPDEEEPLYQGLTLDGLTATPDGQVVAFVEHDLVVQAAPELVLLDGASFAERARIQLPGDTEQRMGVPVVSLSADGQRALVSLGASGEPGVPTAAYLVEDALAGDSAVHPIGFAGAVRWDPGGRAPLSRQEHDAMEAFYSFAVTGDRFDAVPFADDVLVGLGPELAVSRRVDRAGLADPASWLLEADGFRARAGDLSALETLRSSSGGHYERGPRTRCASPAIPADDSLHSFSQVSFQPQNTESCLDWFNVDLFLSDGEIVAVVLDLYEP